jgi:hypothetical protein
VQASRGLTLCRFTCGHESHTTEITRATFSSTAYCQAIDHALPSQLTTSGR